MPDVRTMLQANSYPLTDLELARRLERAEGTANAAFVEARAQVEPAVGATWTEVAGAYAMFDGLDSPITQTFGLGLFGAVADSELDRLEGFFRAHGASTFHEVCPLIPLELLARLGDRGYRPVELSNVLVRPTGIPLDVSATAPAVRRISIDEADVWARTSAAGWSSEGAGVAAFVEGLGMVSARQRGAACFLAEVGGEPIAAGRLSLHDGIALLSGASTVPAARRQGAQLALLAARLRFASQQGAGLAMMVALPGSGSQRNAERQGFRTVYTRTKWQLP